MKGVALMLMLVLLTPIYALDAEVVGLVNLYKKQGIKAVETQFENYLLSQEYWEQYLIEYANEYGYFEDLSFLFVANKSAPNLKLYQVNNSKLTQIGDSIALVAKGKGNKNKEGDLTTPIGSYDLTGRLTGLDQYYGPLAFPMNYPNVYDRSLKKTGGGIWIHGLPLDGNRKELNTRGCIAIDNELLKKYDSIIDYKHTMVITYEYNFKAASPKELAIVLSNLYGWKLAWQNGDLANYLSFYDKNFYNPEGMNFKVFSQRKKSIFAKNEHKDINISRINIAIYPNEENRNMYRISFLQDYKAFLNGKKSFSSIGRKDMYVIVENGTFKIISEH